MADSAADAPAGGAAAGASNAGGPVLQVMVSRAAALLASELARFHSPQWPEALAELRRQATFLSSVFAAIGSLPPAERLAAGAQLLSRGSSWSMFLGVHKLSPGYLPLVAALHADCAADAESPPALAATVAMALGQALFMAGAPAEAEPLLRAALAGFGAQRGEGDPLTLEAALDLAACCDALRQHDEAGRLFARVADGRAAALGQGHVDTLLSRADLAHHLYIHGGKLPEAEALVRLTLPELAKALGPLHSHVLAATTSLIELCRVQAAAVPEAQALLKRQLVATETALKQYGGEGPGKAGLMLAHLGAQQNVGAALMGLGALPQAASVLGRVMERLEPALNRPGAPHDHPVVTQCVELQGMVALHMQDYRGAEPHLRRVMTARMALAPDEPGNLFSLGNLGTSLQGQGRHGEAAGLYAIALEARTRLLGPEHPHTLDSLHSHAGALHSDGQFSEAAPLHKRCWEARQRVLGPDAESTIDSMQCYAHCLQHSRSAKQAREGERLMAAAVEARMKLMRV